MASDPVAERMKTTWNTLARQNAMHYIATDRTDWDIPSFLESGKANVRDLFASVNAIPGQGSGTAVDVGCGIGRLSFALAEHYQKVIGVDVSEEMIARANELKGQLKVENVEFTSNNGRDLKRVPDSSCDLVFSFVVLQHIPDKEIVLSYIAEFGRVLKPGGCALFQVPVYVKSPLVLPWRGVQSLFRRLLWKLEERKLVSPEKGVAFRGSRLPAEELDQHLRGGGLKILKVSRTKSGYRLCDNAIYYCCKSTLS